MSKINRCTPANRSSYFNLRVYNCKPITTRPSRCVKSNIFGTPRKARQQALEYCTLEQQNISLCMYLCICAPENRLKTWCVCTYIYTKWVNIWTDPEGIRATAIAVGNNSSCVGWDRVWCGGGMLEEARLHRGHWGYREVREGWSTLANGRSGVEG